MVDAELRNRLMALDSDEAREAAIILEARLDDEKMPPNYGAIVAPLIQQAREHLAADPSSALTGEQVWGRAQALIDRAAAQHMAV
jgi:phage baseplate assembly protein W